MNLALQFPCALVLAWSVTIPPSGRAFEPSELVRVVVELRAPPGAVELHRARLEGRQFDRRAHETEIAGVQEQFLAHLREKGISYRTTETVLRLADRTLPKPNRFAFLIDAVELLVPSSDLETIRRMSEVKRVSEDRPFTLELDHSVRYVRASDGPGNKTIFSRAGGPLTRYDGTGQVIAILDTGIEHTHPAFDTRFGDADFTQRTGDLRPVRTAGQPYQEGVHHPKVVYYLALTATTNEDDAGHGTHCATDSAGLKVMGPGLDRIPGNADDQLVEGVAPGALLMAYKLCETSFTCVGTTNIVTALEDALSPVDPLGNPKPVATVINMSFGGGTGDPDAPSAVAADNAALLGAVIVASAGNSGPGEHTIGEPAAARRAIAVGACKDPGAFNNELDVLVPDPLRYGVVGTSSGAQNDAGRPVAPQDEAINAVIMAGAPDVTFPLGQHYVYAGLADTPDQVPAEVSGRIALALRGSTVDLDATGSGAFAHKVAEATAKGAVAVLIFNNEPGELEATTAAASAIPVYGLSKANGEYLRDALGFQSPLFDPDDPLTWGTVSNFPLRIDLPDPATFSPSTTGFSSRGPIDGNRYVKPDVTAPGENIYGGTIPAGGVSPDGGTMMDPSRFISVSGTSFSGPHVTGSSALLRQALLDARGEAPIPAAQLRSGAGAEDQLLQAEVVPQSLVRAALQNTATNLREADNETVLPNSDQRSFLHEIGSGLIHVVQAVDVRAVLGTNERNGVGGPDDAFDPDFLPTYSFGTSAVVNTGTQHQVQTVTVTLENVSGASGAGGYSLQLVDAGATRGDVTRPILGTTGFQVSLGSAQVTLGSGVGNRATFDVTVDVDGRAAPLGLALAGTDSQGVAATEFLWWVRVAGANGERLRMPFSYRAVAQLPDPARKAPFLAAIEDDPTPDQTASGVDLDGSFELSWTYPSGAESPCGFVIERATRFQQIFADDAADPLVAGENTTWSGENWITALHPDTETTCYSPLYTDEEDLRLVQIAALDPAFGPAVLSFRSFEDIEEGFDFASVEASGDDGPFIPLAVYTGSFSGTRNVDLSSFAGQALRLRFRFVTDELISAPVHLGWFIDDIELRSANFHALATVGGGTFTFLVTEDEAKVHSTRKRTEFFRVGALFGGSCTEKGPPSNERSIAIDPRVRIDDPH